MCLSANGILTVFLRMTTNFRVISEHNLNKVIRETYQQLKK